MVAAAVFQRTTGPTYPYKGSVQLDGSSYEYRLVRSAETSERARVVLPAFGEDSAAPQIHYRRYPTGDSLTVVPFVLEGDEWAAYLPIQPAAGKMEYFVTASVDGHETRIPHEVGGSVILRFKDPVPIGVLLPHVILMFLSILVGMRAGLSALFGFDDTRVLTYVALVGMTIGGMILGPIVQKYAFDAYWTGFPFGGDFTDNKTLIMWGAWLVAAIALWRRRPGTDTMRRSIVIGAAVVMVVVYLIPHSFRGSELNYQQGMVQTGHH